MKNLGLAITFDVELNLERYDLNGENKEIITNLGL